MGRVLLYLISFVDFYLRRPPEGDFTPFNATYPILELLDKNTTELSVKSRGSCAYQCIWNDDAWGNPCVAFYYPQQEQEQADPICHLIYDVMLYG